MQKPIAIQAFLKQMAVVTLMLCAGLGTSASMADTLALKYKAYVAGASAGQAKLTVERLPTQFSVTGTARAEGLIEAFSPWRASFDASGNLADDQWQLARYHYVEKDHRKRREVTILNGEITEIKNGKQRPTRPALPGIDVLTALFVDSRCQVRLQLHTGRHGYELAQNRPPQAEDDSGNALDAAECAYQAVDEDGDTTRVRIRFTEVGGHRVPAEIQLSGLVSGRMELVRHSVTPRETGVQVEAVPVESVSVASMSVQAVPVQAEQVRELVVKEVPVEAVAGHEAADQIAEARVPAAIAPAAAAPECL